ncbi:MAG: hypothetical protein ACM37U_14105 [Gemmatimonas sp.]|nr:hypothetical protein [Gemmatimonadaceae bacterium]
MRSLITAAALLSMAMPLAAQQQMGKADPTNAVKGTGQLPSGLMMRFDPIDNPANVRPGRPAPAKPTPDLVKVVTMGSGLHFTTGPAAIYYNPKDAASGVYAVSASFGAKKSMQHEAYGIFIGGSNLQDSTQSYLYFEIRPMDGSILIQHRNGDVASKMDKIVPWTPNDAVSKDDPTDGHSANTLMIHVAPDSVHFLVNGKLVKGMAKSELMGAKTDGQTGIRINHNTDIHVDWKGVSK